MIVFHTSASYFHEKNVSLFEGLFNEKIDLRVVMIFFLGVV
jgi:hypothetical protein